MKKRVFFITLGLVTALAVSSPTIALADSNISTITMEPCGAYLFQWRPIDCGNGRAFAILVGGNTIQESNVILNRGYDYAYTNYANIYPRPWGHVPELVNVNGIWGIPENERILPDGTQPVTRITLLTNNKKMNTNERYVDVVHLPSNTDTSSLPPEVRKYLINVDGSDAGAYNGTITAGWETENGYKKYRKNDGTFVANSWMSLDGETYYFDENGHMLKDSITPDGIYVNSKGEKTSYIPGWAQVDGEWRYIKKDGYYAANTWIQDEDGKWYYFNMACQIVTNSTTPDSFYVGPDGVWDGNASTAIADNSKEMGPGYFSDLAKNGWESDGEKWRFKLEDGSYVTNAWKQDADGKWYYFNGDSIMVTNQTTPDGFYVGEDGVWNE